MKIELTGEERFEVLVSLNESIFFLKLIIKQDEEQRKELEERIKLKQEIIDKL